MLPLKNGYKALLIALITGVLIVSVALGASSATLRNYQVDFVEVTGTGTTRTWTYAITANGDESAAMSDWTLTIDDRCGYKFASPPGSAPGARTYATLTSYIMKDGTDFCASHSCQAANYEVHKFIDSAAGQRWITFQNADTPLSSTNPVTHLFQMQVATLDLTDPHIGDTGVSLDTGTGTAALGVISGPVCPPTAVQLVNLTASTGLPTTYWAMLAGIFLALVGFAGLFILRKKIA
jgi:hypothetical protein